MEDPIKNKSVSSKAKGLAPEIKSKKKSSTSTSRSIGIPKPVANRMARRIVFTSGLPTVSGMGVFIVSYIVVSRGISDIPPIITLITSAACFLLGLVGLSYGLLSTSWDESPGSFLGFENIRPNINRMRSAFKAQESE